MMIASYLARLDLNPTPPPTPPAAVAGHACSLAHESLLHQFFGLPTWYQYMHGVYDTKLVCHPAVTSISDIWLILLAVTNILLHIAGLIAVFMVIYAGIALTTSEGEPDKTAQARNTIINALIGLGISVSAALIIDFIAGSL